MNDLKIQPIELPSTDWDYDDLEGNQIFEVFAATTSFIAFPFDRDDRNAMMNMLNDVLVEKKLDERQKLYLKFFLNGAIRAMDAHTRRRITAHYKLVSYLCRMICCNEPDLNKGASIGKAYVLTEGWAGRNRRVGLRRTNLKRYWVPYKGVAPLSTALVLSNKRARRNLKKLENNGKALTKRTRLVHLLAETTKLLPLAANVQETLLNYDVWGGGKLLAQDDLVFFPDQLRLTSAPIRWKPLNERDFDQLKTERR